MQTITNAGSAEETRKLGEKISAKLKPGDVMALYGGLGAGKTTFVQGVLKGLGTDENVTSPTFVIINEYKSTKYPVHHIDLYRMDTQEEIEDLGIRDLLGADSIVLVEWPEKMGAMLPKDSLMIKIETISENERSITMEGPDL